MATLVLGAAGAAIGGSIGGAILGVSAATIGGFIGSTIGSVVDNWIVSSLAPTQRIEGARLDNLRITSATEGAVIPRLYGSMRMGGNIVWATDFREETKTTTQGGGKGGGGGGKVKTTEYLYFASFAVALCEGPITGIGRIWADGKLLDTAGITWRWYPGDESQAADPFITAKMGAADTPAYRGTAYVVFEDLPLGNYGNRIPQLSFEVFRPLADPDTAEGLTQAVTMIPASGEFAYATQGIRKGSGGSSEPENLNALTDTADMVVGLDRLQAMAPKVESVSLVVAWFGDDLRAGNCKVRPGVEVTAKTTTPSAWSVNGVSRANAFLVSRDDQDRPVYGGTPADFAVVGAVRQPRSGARRPFHTGGQIGPNILDTFCVAVTLSSRRRACAMPSSPDSLADHVKAHRPGVDRVAISRLLGKLYAIIRENGVDLIGHRPQHVLQKLPSGAPVGLFNELRHGKLAGAVDAYKEIELALSGLRLTVGSLVTEPLRIHGKRADMRAEATRLLEMVGLPDNFAGRFPHQLSGGQARRIGVARALALDPRLIIADEPAAGLDMSVQAEVLNLLAEMQGRLGIAILVITHNLNVVRHVTGRMAITYLGRFVEIGPTNRIFHAPCHPYTEALLLANPEPDPDAARARITLDGEMPSPRNRPEGCEFHTRCPRAQALCKTQTPNATIHAPGHEFTCHFPVCDSCGVVPE
jgi:oligopeptide/dipeptide ABC transporter ATP-binding protein